MTQLQIPEKVPELKSLNEPEWFLSYREGCLRKAYAAPPLSFKHGLNTLIEPKETLALHAKKAHVAHKVHVKNETSDSHETSSTITILQSLQNCPEKIAKRMQQLLQILKTTDDTGINWYLRATTSNILILHIKQSSKDAIQIDLDAEGFTSVFVLPEPNVSAQIIITKKAETGHDGIYIDAAEGSSITCTLLQLQPETAQTVQERIACVQENAEVNWIDAHLGSHYTRSLFDMQLIGRGAQGKTTAIYITSGNQGLDLYTASVHSGEQTSSNIITRGVATDHAKALSRGLVKIKSTAANAQGYEQQDALLLSRTAQAHAIPNLEIDNHDVKCSHGSTIGHLDEDKLFYLKARGLTESEAKKLIITGYFAPVLETLPKETQELVQAKVEEKIA